MKEIEKFKVGDIQAYPHGRTDDICRIADKINEIIEQLNNLEAYTYPKED